MIPILTGNLRPPVIPLTGSGEFLAGNPPLPAQQPSQVPTAGNPPSTGTGSRQVLPTGLPERPSTRWLTGAVDFGPVPAERHSG